MGMKPSKKTDEDGNQAKKPEFKKPPVASRDVKIIRIMDTNLDSNLSIKRALSRIKGVSFMFSNAICKSTGINPTDSLGSLSEEQIRNIENNIKNPVLPAWMLNRKRDLKSGKDMHITSNDISMYLREDISLMKKMRCYKGVRHELGQPVRGQRTRSTFRKNKSVGVVRKKAAPAAAKPSGDKK